MESNFNIDYGVSKLYDTNYTPKWSNDYMDAMRQNIVTADYIKEKSSCNIKRLKKKIHSDNNEITHIGDGAYATAYMIDHPDDPRYPDNVYVMKNTKYEHDDEIDMEDVNTNSEIKMIRMLNNLIFEGITPHILLYIKHARCTQCTKPSMRLITEVCKSNMEEFDTDNQKWPLLENIDIAIFQVLFTLDAIHTFYPSWRHNDLRHDNVFLDKTEKKDYYYHAYGNYYKINTNMFAKISDFGHSNCPGIVDNKLANPQEEYDWDPESFGMRPTKNQYYDMHTFLNSINCEYIDDDTSSLLDLEMECLIDEMIPEEYRTQFVVKNRRLKRKKNKNLENDCLIPDIELFTPKDAFRFFEHFKVNKEDIPEGEHIFSATPLSSDNNSLRSRSQSRSQTRSRSRSRSSSPSYMEQD